MWGESLGVPCSESPFSVSLAWKEVKKFSREDQWHILENTENTAQVMNRMNLSIFGLLHDSVNLANMF